MSLEPKKLKSYIGKLKECLDKLPMTNVAANGAESVSASELELEQVGRKCYKLLLISELCQRGVILTSAIDDMINDQNNTKLMDMIHNAAGKTLLDESQVPKPLVAASSVISSMTADKLADSLLLLRPSDISKMGYLSSTDGDNNEEEAEKVKRRCDDVTDIRFKLLLSLGQASFLKSNCVWSALNDSTLPPPVQCFEITAVLLLRIALGNLFRAVSFSNPDQPPMWKKSLDACVKLHVTLLYLRKKINHYKMFQKENDFCYHDQEHQIEEENIHSMFMTMINEKENVYEAYHSIDAVYPLQNLIRIAASKNNMKRVSELSLRLTESYICKQSNYNHTNNDTTDNNNNNDIQNQIMCHEGSSVWNDISTMFVNQYIPKDIKTIIGTTTMVDKSKTASRAKEALQKFDGTNVDDLKLKLLHQILSLRVEIEHEGYLIQSLSASRYEATKNRIGISLTSSKKQETTTKSASCKESILVEVKREIFTESVADADKVENFDEYNSGSQMDRAAKKLLETILSTPSSTLNESIPKDMQNAIFELLTIQTERLVKKAQAYSIKYHDSKKLKKGNKKPQYNLDDVENALDCVEIFVKPLLDAYDNQSVDNNDDNTNTPNTNISSSKMNLFKTASQSILIVKWMRQDKIQTPLRLVESAKQCLSSYQDQRLRLKDEIGKRRREKNSQENVIATTLSNTTSQDSANLDLEWSIWAGRCHLYLSRSNDVLSDENTIECKEITLKAIEVAKTTTSPNHVQYGMPFLMILVCWSGLYKAPWPFCDVSAARSIIRFVKESLQLCESEWGREISEMERMMLSLIEADAECGFLSGGFADKARDIYRNVLLTLQNINVQGTDSLLHSHCIAGLIMIALSQNENNQEALQNIYSTAVENAQQSLKTLISLQESNDIPSFFQFCLMSGNFGTSLHFHLCHLRTLVAESLIRSLEFTKAEAFLEQAVKDSPNNFDAAFALGAFWLRMSFSGEKNSSSKVKYMHKSLIKLKKSLELDKTKAGPFSLLGIYYENKEDNKRAIGCFSKALLIDPSHPVAGRGILRLSKEAEVLSICEKAIRNSSNTNGWAWKKLGDIKAISDGLDEHAILCYQNALRCRDIESIKQDSLGTFFAYPFNAVVNMKECSESWAALASSYRRLGKYSASLRAYEAALASSPINDYFCAWAQVELELGLLDDAASKFELVLQDSGSCNSHFIASYGFASCKLLSANRNTAEGKYGAALEDLYEGIDAISNFASNNLNANFFCTLKLLGDLYSHGYNIPCSVFAGMGEDEAKNEIPRVTKVKFIKKGESTYMQLLEKVEAQTKNTDDKSLITAALNDIGTNLLLQARILDISLKKANTDYATKDDKKVDNLLMNAKNFFIRAVELNELDPLAWFGLGCSLSSLDAVLSQHALCRALQLDKNLAEAWVNLSLIYSERNKLSRSEAVINVLTQIGDTPLMWIARGLLLEKQAKCAKQVDVTEETLHSASDAYRACLQTTRNPTALLGLALTCRQLGVENESFQDDYKIKTEEIARLESEANLSIFLQSSGNNDPILEFIHYTTIAEKDRGDNSFHTNTLVTEVLTSAGFLESSKTGYDHIEVQKQTIYEAQKKVKQNPNDGVGWLNLAKLLVLSFTQVKNPSKHSRDLVLDVVERANYILKAAVTNPTMLYPTGISSKAYKNIASNPVKASQLSDAHALSSWVYGQGEDINSHNLQRALILDPESHLARGKIEYFSL